MKSTGHILKCEVCNGSIVTLKESGSAIHCPECKVIRVFLDPAEFRKITVPRRHQSKEIHVVAGTTIQDQAFRAINSPHIIERGILQQLGKELHYV